MYYVNIRQNITKRTPIKKQKLIHGQHYEKIKVNKSCVFCLGYLSKMQDIKF